MATGRNLQEGRSGSVSNITPGADFRTGEAEVWSEAERVFAKFESAAKKDQLRRAQVRGAAEGVEAVDTGVMPERGPLFFGDVAEARTAAAQAAYTAKIRGDMDAREAEIRRDNALDPEAYERLSGEMVSGFIQSAPPEFAVDVETYARTLSGRGLERVADARSARDDMESNQALTLRATSLQERLVALAADPDFGPESFEFMQAEVEYSEIQGQREANPSLLYSTEQRVADDQKLGLDMTTARVGRDMVGAYTAGGGGLAGLATAQRFIRDTMEGDAFAGVTPEDRAKINRDLQTQLNQFSQVERAQAREVAEEERARAAARREARGELSLQIVLGEIGETEILARTDLNEADKAQLVRSAREQTRRAAAEDRATLAMEAAGRTAAYSGLRDQADAGALSQAEIASQLNAGLITPGQAQTLRDRNDTQLRPIIDDVMAPVTDYMRRPGMGVRPDLQQRRAIAEQAATQYARANPGATLEQRLAAGRAIAERVFGAPRPASAGGASGDGAAVAARVAAVNARIAARARTSNPYSTAEANRLRREARQGPENGD